MNTTHTEWCIIRFAHGKFERVKTGYKTKENALKSIPAVARAYLAKRGDHGAMYAVGSYNVSMTVTRTEFRRYCA